MTPKPKRELPRKVPRPADVHSFAASLIRLRNLRKWSQRDLAKACGLEPSAISHFETGRRLPSFDNLLALANALNTSLDPLSGRLGIYNEAGGPKVRQLVIHFAKLSADDQDAIVKMTAMLAEKPTGMMGCGNG